MFDGDDVRRVATVLAAIADPTRVRILDLLARGPMFVAQLSAALGGPPTRVSRHLGALRGAGLVAATRVGRRAVYALRADVFTTGDGRGSLGTLCVGPHRLVFGVPDRLPRRAIRSLPRPAA